MKQRAPKLLEPWALVLGIFVQEAVFKASTTGGFWPQLLFVALFSCALGLGLRLLFSALPSRAAYKHAATAALALTGLVFCVEYFVYREFKLFYDLNTVTAGAGDAATGFTDQITALVFSAAGLAHIAAFMAPPVTYALLFEGEHLSTDHDDPFATRIRLARNAVTALLVALLAVFSVGTYGQSLTERYNFQAAVTNVGLLPSLVREVGLWVSGSEVSFSEAPSEPQETDEDQEEAQEEEPEYEPNALDIDFDALAQATEGTWADLDRYVSSLTPSAKNPMTGAFEGFNLIFISAEAFSAEAIRPDTTPTLYRMATQGMQFTDYYQFDSAGTTGGECGNIFGLLPTEGGSSVKITATHNNYYTMGNALNRLGYNGWAFHNNTYTYYSRDQTHNNLGYSNGFMGYGNGMEQWVSWQWPQSDLEMVEGTFSNLYGSADQEPFNVYYMSVSGHSDYGRGQNLMAEKHWDEVADLPYSDPVKGYLAANIELDAAMEWLIGRLEEEGMADHTAIVIGADHFPYGLDDDGPLGHLPYTSELYGFDVTTYFERDHNRLIVWSGCLEDEEPIVVDSPTFALDILPTLLNLFGCEWDSRLLPGRDVFSDKPALVFDLAYDWKSELGTYYAGSGTFVPNDGAQVPSRYVDAMNADVNNRINYCRGVLTTDYYAHVFGS